MTPLGGDPRTSMYVWLELIMYFKSVTATSFLRLMKGFTAGWVRNRQSCVCV